MFLKTLIFVLFIIHTTYSIAEIDNVSKDESKNNNCQNFCDGFYGIESSSRTSCFHGCSLKTPIWSCGLLCLTTFKNIHACTKGCDFNNKLIEKTQQLFQPDVISKDSIEKPFDRLPIERPHERPPMEKSSFKKFGECSFMRNRLPRFVFVIVDAMSILFILCIVFVIIRAIRRMRNKNRTIIYREDELPLYEDIVFDKKLPVTNVHENAEPLPEKQKLDI